MKLLLLKFVQGCLIIAMTVLSGHAMDTLETKKEYLVLLFPGNNNEMSRLKEVVPAFAEKSGKNVDCFEVMEASYPRDHWFTPPYTSVSYFTSFPKNPFQDYPGYFDKLMDQRYRIEEKLKQLELGSDRLILAGFSEGGTAALHLGLSVMDEPVGAIVSFCSLWQPQPITNSVQFIYLTNGQDDNVISHNCANGYMKLLKGNLDRTTTVIKHKKFRKDSGHYISETQVSIAASETTINLFSK